MCVCVCSGRESVCSDGNVFVCVFSEGEVCVCVCVVKGKCVCSDGKGVCSDGNVCVLRGSCVL